MISLIEAGKKRATHFFSDVLTCNQDFSQVRKTKLLEHFQQQQQEKWLAHVTRTEINDITNMLTFRTTLNKRQGRKCPSILERVIAVSLKRLLS